MTYITQPTGQKIIFSSRLLTMLLTGLVLVILQSSAVQAQWTTPDGQGNISNTNSGNVGIGTTTPTANVKLDVAGAVVINYSGDTVNSLLIKATGNNNVPAFQVLMPATGLQKAFQLANTGNTSGWASFEYNVGASGKPGLALGSGSAARDTRLFRDSASVLRTDSSMIVDRNLGVGTTSPAFDSNTARYLTVDGGSGVVGSIGAAGGTGNAGTAVSQVAFVNSSLGTNEKRLATIVGSTDTDTNSGVLDFYTASAGTFPMARLRINSSGNVGIGTTTPIQKLQIGTNTPTSTATPDALSLGGTYSSVAGTNPKLRLYDDNSGNVYGLGVSANQFDFTIPSGTRYVWSVNGTEKMRLDASGNLTVTGNIAAKYQDVAEWVQSSQELVAGTVVVIDQTKSNHVVASSQAYDTRVAGVISAQPGITLGANGAGKVLVATTGRVRIKVDASQGSIQVGDLLVTSDVPGVAMKSQPINVGGIQIHRPGTLIGKALDPLEKGASEILVLLSLQ